MQITLSKKTEYDIFQYLALHGPATQRQIAEEVGCSLGAVNQGLKSLRGADMLNDALALTDKAEKYLKSTRPRRAVILAAGLGMRMVPINREVSKGMLEIKGEPLVERLIRQLLEIGIQEIFLVVGFMKEQYEYLIDLYGVKLIVNREYEQKNNYFSLLKAADHLDNAYILPCDLWCEQNPFRTCETCSWYLIGTEKTYKSDISINRRGELIRIRPEESGNRMIGIAYLTSETAKKVRENLYRMDRGRQYEGCFWEDALYENAKMLVWGKLEQQNSIFEINTYEQLRQLDSDSNQLKSDIIRLIASVFDTVPAQIQDIRVLKKGMTNRSFLFSCQGRRFIMRIPGEGTDQMIDRQQEYQVYQALSGEKICDDIYYLNPDNGYKITAFLENARNCDASDPEDVRRAMAFLRKFHEKKLQVSHTFDLFGQIEFYETLWGGRPSVYRDYAQTKQHVMSLKKYIDRQDREWVLTHIDAVPDNFLLSADSIRLIDWEYAGMQDPHLDIAMFAIYSLYERDQVEQLIDFYFPEGLSCAVRLKIYCYISAAGLLWSNWCEYKRHLGVEFGEYSLRQYRYAKDYYRLFQQLSQEEESHA